MDLTPYVERLRRDLTAATATGAPEVEAAAERVVLTLDPAVRMVLLEALADAAAEISAHLDTDTVDVRLAGREPEFVVTPLAPAFAAPAPPAPPRPPGPADADDGSQSRITLRLPEILKARAEELAVDLSQSLNTWIVDAIREGIDGRAADAEPRPPGGARRRRANRVQGWVG